MKAEDYDSAEPIDRKPVLTLGTYEAVIAKSEYKDFSEKLVVEFDILKSEGKEALPVGSQGAWFIKDTASSKSQAPFVAKRVKGFLYPVTGRTKIPGEEIIDLVRNQAASFVGKKLKIKVSADTDEDGNEKLKDDGTPWLVASFASA